MSELEDCPYCYADVLRLLALLVWEIILERIAIIDTQSDEPQTEIKPRGEQRPMVLNVRFVIPQNVFGDL